MPLLEAPAEYLDSSPDHSLQAELPVLLAPPGPAALAQVRMPPPEVRLNQQNPAQQQQLPRVQLNRRLLVRRNSFDRDVPVTEETQHLPAFVHLLPVVLPQQAPEPTLDELLRRVTQRTDLEAVESVRLRVISYTISLSRLSLFLPRLQSLDLSGSVLSSLRDLGYGLLQLTRLDISNCGLNSFDGTSGLPAIRVLVADGNMIQRVDPLAELAHLRVLRARNNRISELGLLSFLGMCPQLQEVELQGNPVCRLPLYRSLLARSVPTLRLLDGRVLNSPTELEEPPSQSSSDLESGSEAMPQRPATAPAPVPDPDPDPVSIQISRNPGIRRQMSASSASTPVAGSVLGLVRQRRRRSGHAWVSSSSSSSGSASSGSSFASSARSTRAPSMSSCSSNSSLDVHSSNYAFSAQSTLD
ncbi:LOW QUALITY PROTEIN: leucine-rich repeat-containing protein 9 [Drosophila ficusphila]|uniref:LOW QUALITY PROTEIN: leucine-rich repeat-containing protein 9 n=1 Tax=Drosophila ficusphila TaxID=30025 RepID=UPI0007E6D168|nr:LOW QUALITY PROTEIN: leucine-rich repeat-containing protein 9 [Drosophila ficusphila]